MKDPMIIIQTVDSFNLFKIYFAGLNDYGTCTEIILH